ncbi:hypothetical protein A3F56_03855 [Candidatus Kaiserbacteria bacterium RIFCSPHIGHO2_12_FULL_55_13]|nr:MAG: hypothetical protein A3F56_03855 [Candidatus Kaiserbacteria bacterium RIFCSPHIGHO2_12_FULL_55_13]OGG82602.1 MAG: hypothetical protein A3A42_00675 [Candidatus Kaiserbacteria bacterium RIFCSPLOWO2_01_FULL_55_25]
MDIKNRNTQAIIGAAVVVVVLLAAWLMFARPVGNGGTATDTKTPSESTSTEEALNPSMVGTGEAVTVRDQAAGTSVSVASVTLNEMGWVAIRDESGRVLGAARFDAGTWSDMSVPLLRATAAAGSYQVLLYVDDGDKQYDLHKDILIMGANGEVAGTTFKTL